MHGYQGKDFAYVPLWSPPYGGGGFLLIHGCSEGEGYKVDSRSESFAVVFVGMRVSCGVACGGGIRRLSSPGRVGEMLVGWAAKATLFFVNAPRKTALATRPGRSPLRSVHPAGRCSTISLWRLCSRLCFCAFARGG